MSYRSLRECVDDLAATGQLVTIDQEIDPRLEAAEIQRRVFAAGGPAIYFARVRGTSFPMVSNLFGTIDRARFIFRHTLDGVRRLIAMKADPEVALRHPLRALAATGTALAMRPRRVRNGPVLTHQTTIGQLPQQQSWPDDGGAFIMLPQVYTEDADRPGMAHSNLGMYRIQLSGGRYEANREIGLHYQIHRGIGVHHAAALKRGVPFRVNVFVGGPPAMNLAAVMPLPEGLSELRFAGALMGRRVRMIDRGDGTLPIHADADFCITGTVDPHKQLPEGPFGDHLGYYSLAHDFPVLRVEHVYHRSDAIWPFTVVGRPPQEDTIFGELIHDLTGPLIPTVIPGVKAVHAVDAAGVHPLLLAIGSERYTPYARLERPQELLTQANAILGQGQLSLAKYLWIAAADEAARLDIHDIPAFFAYMLARVDWTRDLHFQTATTIDTLDYSGSGLNEGSKVVIAAAGPVRRTLPNEVPSDLKLPPGWTEPRLAMPGVLVVRGPAAAEVSNLEATCGDMGPREIGGFPLVVVVDDSQFAAASLANFLWVTFTRSNPAADIGGSGAFVRQKHWGCTGSLVIDARRKPHHAPPLEPDAETVRRVDQLAARGGPLHGII
ncbi:MAG: UbiD family decarboxylase [Planctomycetia bacterium]|nr:UbiD family decarboxylase [Planctomycetia bacterium]